MKLGFIGLGNMGNRLAPRLLEAGHELTVNDLNRDAANKLLDLGASWADSPKEVAAASEVSFAMVAGPTEVEKVVTAPEIGLVHGLSAGKVFIDLTTSDPTMTRKLAALCHEKGAEMLDSPVSSGGGTTLVVGGDKATFDRCEPVLKALATHVYYLGDSGAGNMTKLVRQYTGFVSFWAQAEALVLAAKAGLDLNIVNEFLDVTGARNGGTNWLPRMMNRDFGTPETAGARLDIVAKDVALAVELARRLGAQAGTGLAADDLMKRAQAQGLGKYEFFRAVELLEEAAGTEVKSA